MSSTQQTRLCNADDVPEGGVVRVDLNDFDPLAVYRLEGRFYATADGCTHAEASLSDGVVEGEEIECPFHGGSFNIKTGDPVNPPCVIALRTYPVEVRDGEVFADLGDD